MIRSRQGLPILSGRRALSAAVYFLSLRRPREAAIAANWSRAGLQVFDYLGSNQLWGGWFRFL